MLLNQTVFNNWVAGGGNSVTLTTRVDYDWNFTRDKYLFDNRIILGYGIRTEAKRKTRKEEDIIDTNSVYGYRFKKSWYYASRLNFKTQFWKGYDHDKNPLQKLSNFMSPGYLILGFGVDYRPDDLLTVNIHPLTSRMTFVADKDLFNTYNKNSQLIGSQTKAYGIDPGGGFRYELGTYFGYFYKIQLMEQVFFDNRLFFF